MRFIKSLLAENINSSLERLPEGLVPRDGEFGYKSDKRLTQVDLSLRRHEGLGIWVTSYSIWPACEPGDIRVHFEEMLEVPDDKELGPQPTIVEHMDGSLEDLGFLQVCRVARFLHVASRAIEDSFELSHHVGSSPLVQHS